MRGYSSVGRAPALQAGGQRFEPVYLHHFLFYGYYLSLNWLNFVRAKRNNYFKYKFYEIN